MAHLRLEQRPDRPTQMLLVALAVPLQSFRSLKKRRPRETGKILRESYFALLICAIAGMLAGISLSSMTDILVLLPGLLIIIPGAIAMRGNIFASLGARLGTYLHSGQVEPENMKTPLVRENIMAVIAQTFLLSASLGILAFLFVPSETGGLVLLPVLLMVSILAGVISGALLMIVTYYTAVGGFKRGWDPDNITAPIITTAGDILTIPIVFLSARLVLSLDNSLLLPFASLFAIATLVVAITSLTNKEITRRILKQSLPVLLVCAFLATIAGHFLESRLESLLVTAGLLILFPPFNDTAGNLGSILSARLSSAAHLGTTRIGAFPDKTAMQNITAIMLLLLAIFPFIGILSHYTALLIGLASPGLTAMIMVSVAGGLILTMMVICLSYYFTYVSYRISVDPDNVVIPLLTSTTDAAGIIILIGVLSILGIA